MFVYLWENRKSDLSEYQNSEHSFELGRQTICLFRPTVRPSVCLSETKIWSTFLSAFKQNRNKCWQEKQKPCPATRSTSSIIMKLLFLFPKYLRSACRISQPTDWVNFSFILPLRLIWKFELFTKINWNLWSDDETDFSMMPNDFDFCIRKKQNSKIWSCSGPKLSKSYPQNNWIEK